MILHNLFRIIETLIRGFCLEGSLSEGSLSEVILSGGDFVRVDYVRRGFCPGFKKKHM